MLNVVVRQLYSEFITECLSEDDVKCVGKCMSVVRCK